MIRHKDKNTTIHTDVLIVNTSTTGCTDAETLRQWRHTEVRDVTTQQMRPRAYPSQYLVRTRDLWQRLNQEVVVQELTGNKIKPEGSTGSQLRPVVKRIRQWCEAQEPYVKAQHRYTQEELIWCCEITVPWLTRRPQGNNVYGNFDHTTYSSNPAHKISLTLQSRLRKWLLSTAEITHRPYNKTEMGNTLEWLLRQLEDRVSTRQLKQIQRELCKSIVPLLNTTQMTRRATLHTVIARLLQSQGAIVNKDEQARMQLTARADIKLSEEMQQHVKQLLGEDLGTES